MTLNMTTDPQPPAPAYDMTEAGPPAYPRHERSSLLVDEKARIAAYVPPPTTPSPAAAAAAPLGTSIASNPTSLQPWSKVPHPAGTFIPESSWKAFVADLRAAVSPTTKQKTLAVLAGLGVWVGTSWAPLGGLTTALIWKKATEKRVAADLAAMQLQVEPAEANSLGKVVEQYNTLWQGVGVRVRLDAVDKAAAYRCHCGTPQQQQQPRQRGCCGGGGGCGGRRCASCGKRRGGKMREEVRRPIVQITVERLDPEAIVRTGPSARSTPGTTTPQSIDAVLEEHPTASEKEKWIEVKEGEY